MTDEIVLQKLCDAAGVSGCEDEVRRIIAEAARPYADEMTVDAMGNLIVLQRGKSAARRVMVCAHMDEVGLIVTQVTDDGYLRFDTVGGIDARVLVGKRVSVGKERVPGVIALKAIHLQKKQERGKSVPVSALYIDIGASDRAQAQALVQLGDTVVFDTAFGPFGNDCYKAKALDDRVGCAALLQLLRHFCSQRTGCDLYAVFTVQEEVGCRGAAAAARRVQPEAALVLEATTCSDVSGVPQHLEVTRLGGGAAVSILDRASYSDVVLTRRLVAACADAGVPVQYKRTTMGGNDAGAIQLSLSGVRTAAVSVPCRYLHSPVGVVSRRDVAAQLDAARLFMQGWEEWIG